MSGEILYQITCHVQPLLRRIIGNRAATCQDWPAPFRLCHGSHHLINNLRLAPVRQWPSFCETPHQALVRHGKCLTQAWPRQTMTPTHCSHRVVYTFLEVDLITLLLRVGMHMHNVEPASTGLFEYLQIVRTT